MVDAFASGKTKAVEPSFGSYVDEWNIPCNSNFGTFDAALSGTTSINVSSIAATSPFVNITFSEFNVTANPTPWTQPNAGQNLRINISGVLSFGITVYLQRIPGFWIFSNNTSGSFPITVSTTASSGSSVIIPQGYSSVLFSDGTNVIWADQGNVIANVPQAVPSGTIFTFAGTSVPTGYLACDGSSYLASAYPNLYAAIGTTWGGSGSNFNVPDLRGMYVRGTGTNGTTTTAVGPAVGAYQPDTYLNHTHTATSTDSGHTHPFIYSGPNANGGGDGWLVNTGYNATINTKTGQANITTTVDLSTTGGTETAPKSMGVYYIIRT